MEKIKIIRIGIVGCGKISKSHSQAYPDHVNSVVVGFYDRIKKRALNAKNEMEEYMQLIKEAAKEMVDEDDKIHLKRCEIFEKEVKVYDNIHSLLENVDVIDIATPNDSHAPYAIWALKMNKSVMSEKPAALCSLETKWICETAQKSNGYYQINENFLWQLYIKEMNEIAFSGVIGKISHINIKLGHGGPSWGWQTHFLNPSLSGGGVLSDMGFHAIGLAFGILKRDFKIKKMQSIRMESGTQKEKTLDDRILSQDYYLQNFMVEDDANFKVWFYSEKDSQEIEIDFETSWSKTFQSIVIFGNDGKCELDWDEDNRRIINIYQKKKKKVTRTLIPQGRDSHQLEILDFLNHILENIKPHANEILAHNMQTIVSGTYLSNLRAFESSQKSTKGTLITPQDLDSFYDEMISSGCPKSILLQEIVFKFMSPFTSKYKID